MDRPTSTIMKLSLFATAAVAAGLGACTDPGEPEVGTSPQELLTQNGLPVINGLNTGNGLNTSNGLTDGVGLMTTAAGRNTLAYLVRCALPAGRSITKRDQYGKAYAFSGALGMGAAWETGACNVTCQEAISACMVAHINTAGVNVPLWIVTDPSSQPQIGWGLNSTYPNQEGSFFGNIFVSPPKMYYCNGRNFDAGVVPGRIGFDDQATKPYVDPWGYNAPCSGNCAAADYPYASSGYKACYGFNTVVTVWRK